jgi:hypothetical protein
MSGKQLWNDAARDQLRETLCGVILGEIRLAKRDPEYALEMYRQAYIDEVCPQRERATFVRFAADQFTRAAAQVAAEQATWPQETDCDRLDRAQAALRRRGILFWQASPCCDTCTYGELGERIEEIDRRYPGFRNHVRGYSFFIDQNLPEMLAESTELSVYLAYGWISPDRHDVPPEDYEQLALGIAREVCQCLHDEGFEIDWNGKPDRKIGISLVWQRRTMLE